MKTKAKDKEILTVEETILGLDDARDEMIRMEELEQAKKEVQKSTGEKPISQKAFKVI